MVLKQSLLKSRLKKVKFTSKKKDLPFSQGYAINYLIKRYKINAIKWGWGNSTIALETKKQFLLWEDKGSSLEFLGLINK